MTSILTNTSAMTALQSLTATQKSLAKVQKQIATGLAVNDASDNPGVWALATSMRTDVAALGAITNSITVGSTLLSTTTPAVTAVLSALNNIKSAFARISSTSGTAPITAASSTDSISGIQSTIAAQQQTIIAVMAATSVGGVNLLDGSQGSLNIVDSYTRSSSGSSYGSLFIDPSLVAFGGTSTTAPSQSQSGGGLLGASLSANTARAATSGFTSSSTSGNTTTYSGVYASDSVLGFQLTSGTTTSADYAKISAGLDAAIAKVTAGSVQLSSYNTILTNQGSMISSLTDSTNSGIGALVDADMNVASTRLQALQTQQQLGIQALAIANENSQLILKLFGG